MPAPLQKAITYPSTISTVVIPLMARRAFESLFSQAATIAS
jgi:hypothetical protein